MNTKAQRAKLGAFIAVALALAVLVVAGFTSLSLLERRSRYVVHFGDSVEGLEVGARVSLKGVRVGNVLSISLTDEPQPRVRVTLEVKHGTPIYRDARASLTIQGITGLKDLQLYPGTHETGELPPGSTIEASAGGFGFLAGQAESIGNKLDQLLQNLGELTAGDNQERIGELLDHTNKLLAEAVPLLRSATATSDAAHALLRTSEAPLTRLLTHAGTAAQELSQVSATWNDLGRETQMAVQDVRGELSAADLASTMKNVNSSVASLRALIDAAGDTLLQNRTEFNMTMRNLRRASDDLREFSAALRERPSRLLLSDPPPPRSK